MTQSIWQVVKGDNPSRFNNKPTQSVESVSWEDCQEFFAWVNEVRDGPLALSLGSETEWKNAARAGSQSVFLSAFYYERIVFNLHDRAE